MKRVSSCQPQFFFITDRDRLFLYQHKSAILHFLLILIHFFQVKMCFYSESSYFFSIFRLSTVLYFLWIALNIFFSCRLPYSSHLLLIKPNFHGLYSNFYFSKALSLIQPCFPIYCSTMYGIGCSIVFF